MSTWNALAVARREHVHLQRVVARGSSPGRARGSADRRSVSVDLVVASTSSAVVGSAAERRRRLTRMARQRLERAARCRRLSLRSACGAERSRSVGSRERAALARRLRHRRLAPATTSTRRSRRARSALLPLPSHAALRSTTPRLFAAGVTFSAYSFASIPFGNSTRKHSMPSADQLLGELAPPPRRRPRRGRRRSARAPCRAA